MTFKQKIKIKLTIENMTFIKWHYTNGVAGAPNYVYLEDIGQFYTISPYRFTQEGGSFKDIIS